MTHGFARFAALSYFYLNNEPLCSVLGAGIVPETCGGTGGQAAWIFGRTCAVSEFSSNHSPYKAEMYRKQSYIVY